MTVQNPKFLKVHNFLTFTRSITNGTEISTDFCAHNEFWEYGKGQKFK